MTSRPDGREGNDVRAREIRDGHFVGETVFLGHRIDVQDVAILRGGETFIETVLTIDDQVIEEVHGEIVSRGHCAADDRAHEDFAKCANQVAEAFNQLTVRRITLHHDIRGVEETLLEGSTVWVNDIIPYRREAVETPEGPTLVLTRDGRVLDDIGLIKQRRRRATLTDYSEFMFEIDQLREGIAKITTIIRNGKAGRAREPYGYSPMTYFSSGSIPGDHVVVNGATYAVYIIDCMPWSPQSQSRRQLFPRTRSYYQMVRPPGIDPPPGPISGSAYLQVKALCRNGRPLEDLPTTAYDPKLRGFDLHDLEAWMQDEKEVSERLRDAILRREARMMQQRADAELQRVAQLREHDKQLKRRQREERSRHRGRGIL